MKQINFYTLRKMLVALMQDGVIRCPSCWSFFEYADHLISKYHFQNDFVKNDAIVYHLQEIFELLGVGEN